MVYNFFDKRSSATRARSETWEIKFAGNGVRSENMSDKHLAEYLHMSIIRTFEERKVYSSLKKIFIVLILKMWN